MIFTKDDIGKSVRISPKDPAFQTGMNRGVIVNITQGVGHRWIGVRVEEEFGLHDCDLNDESKDCLWVFEEYVSLHGVV